MTGVQTCALPIYKTGGPHHICRTFRIPAVVLFRFRFFTGSIKQSHPGYELMKKQARGFGSILTFEVDSKERAYHILENVKLIQFAESLGGTETLITYPITQTHADLSKEELDRNGITDRILRLSVGIEGAEDLIADLEAVLK